MGRPLMLDMWDRPLTSLLICCMTAVCGVINQSNLQYADVGLSYEKVVHHREYWRLATATFSHINLLHLIFNMSSLWSLGVVEGMGRAGLGKIAYAKYTLVLIVVPLVLVLGIYHVLIYYFKREEYLRSTAVGYSCVVFGWMTIVAQLHPTHQLHLMGFLHLPMSLAPFGSLVFTSLIVPQASFIGHLAGILVGYAIAWGWFAWLDAVLAANLAVLGLLGALWSLHHTQPHLLSAVLRVQYSVVGSGDDLGRGEP